MKIINCLYLVMSLLLSQNISSASNIQPNTNIQSIEWQKIDLTERFKQSYEQPVSKIISSSKYIINVKVDVTEDNKNIKKPKIEKKSDDPADNVKFNNNPNNPKKDDYILFSKLGLEAPLLKDEDVKHRENLKKTISEINTTFDIFTHLKKISIEVFLSDNLDIKTRKSVEDVIRSVQLNLKVKPLINIKYIPMNEGIIQPPKVEPTLLSKILEKAEKFSIAIGLLSAMIVLGFIAAIMFKKYSALQEKHWEFLKKAQKLESNNINKNNEDIKNAKNEGLQGLPSLISEEESIRAFERFMTHFQNHQNDTLMMIKKWIVSNEIGAIMALNALVRQMKNHELKLLFAELSFEERRSWKNKLKNDFNLEDIRRGNAFISEQIIEDIIAPPLVQDTEVLKAIANLSKEQGKNIIENDMDLGAVLLNIMPLEFVSEVLDIVEDEKIEPLIAQSTKYNESNIKSKLESLKEVLPKFEADAKFSPFVENLIHHIELANPKSEKALFRTLMQYESRETTMQIALANLPFEVIGKVSNRIKKQALLLIPQAHRINYLYTLQEPLQSEMLEICAPTGSKTRDVFSMEFEKIKTDSTIEEDVISKSKTYQDTYNSNVKMLVKNSLDLMKETRPLIDTWLNDLTNPVKAQSDIHTPSVEVIAKENNNESTTETEVSLELLPEIKSA